MKGKPCLIVLVDPDQEEMLAPLENALSSLHVQAREGHLVKVMDTRASWKPDQLIKAGTWFSQMTNKVSEARENGILQALFTDRKNKPATWSVVYDQNQVFRTVLRLNDRPVHMFLLDKNGTVVNYAEGSISRAKARVWIQMLKQLALSS